MTELKLLKSDMIGVKFPYDANTVERIKALQNRRWDGKNKTWKVHLAHLPQLVPALNMTKEEVPAEVQEAYDSRWRGVDARLHVGNCFTTISGANLPMSPIEEETSFWVEGAEHTHQYKQGNWDGYKRLMNKRSTPAFPTGLLPRVITVLDRAKTRYVLEDERDEGQPSLNLTTSEDFALRDYQEDAIKEALQHKRGVLHMATGSGKTVVAAHLIARHQRPTVFFVHTKDLLYQAKERFEQVLGVPIGQIGDNIVEPRDITIATIQTAVRAYGEKYEKFDDEDWDDVTDVEAEEKRRAIQDTLERAEVVMFDECHHIASATFYFIAMKVANGFFRYGLSATPYRSDKQDLMIEAALGQRIVKIDSSFLIERGYLVKPLIRFIAMPPPQPVRGRPEYPKIYASEVVENDYRNRLIAQLTAKVVAKNRTVLILVQQIKHGKILQGLIPEAEFVQGNDSSDYRTDCLNRLRSRKLKVLIATTLADEGLDLPTLDCLVLAGGGKSETRALQRVGRALRIAEGKRRALVYDFWDEARFLNEHARKRMQIYQTEDRFEVEIDNRHLKKPDPLPQARR